MIPFFCSDIMIYCNKYKLIIEDRNRQGIDLLIFMLDNNSVNKFKGYLVR